MLKPSADFTITSYFSKSYKDLVRSVLYAIKPPKICNLSDFQEFLHESATRSAGGLVLSYAQKRAGRLHFKLAKEQDYAHDLIAVQIALHAEIVSDLWFLTLDFLHLERNPFKKFGQVMMQDLHNEYIATAPESANQAGKVSVALEKRHFAPKQKTITEFATKSGHILFDLLPMTEGMMEENREVFVGQLRLKYINFFEKLDGRLDRETLTHDFKKAIS